MPADFTVRAYRDGDDAPIRELFGHAFPHAKRDPRHFDWKYRRNPVANGHVSLAFDEGGKLVGHYAGYPVPFRAGNENAVAHQIGDTMTDISIRHVGRGPTSVLGRTALHFYERFCEGSIAFNYGFNVANIQKFSLRFLRSDRVEPVAFRSRDLDSRPLRRIARHERWLRGYQLEVVRETGPEWDDFFERVAPVYRFLVRRDAAWVRWRYLQCPDAEYIVVAIRKWRQLAGWIVFRIEGTRFLWGDALFDPHFGDAVEVALRHVVPAYPVSRIEAWFPPRPEWFHASLAQLELDIEQEPQNLSVMCVPFTWPDAVRRMREDLYYAWGDGDLF